MRIILCCFLLLVDVSGLFAIANGKENGSLLIKLKFNVGGSMFEVAITRN